MKYTYTFFTSIFSLREHRLIAEGAPEGIDTTVESTETTSEAVNPAGAVEERTGKAKTTLEEKAAQLQTTVDTTAEPPRTTPPPRATQPPGPLPAPPPPPRPPLGGLKPKEQVAALTSHLDGVEKSLAETQDELKTEQDLLRIGSEQSDTFIQIINLSGDQLPGKAKTLIGERRKKVNVALKQLQDNIKKAGRAPTPSEQRIIGEYQQQQLELTNVENSVDKITGTVQERADALKSNASLQLALKRTRATLTVTQQKLGATEKKLQAAEADLKTAEADLKTAQGSNADLTRRLGETQTTLRATQKLLADAKTTINTRNNQINTLRKELGATRIQRDRAIDEKGKAVEQRDAEKAEKELAQFKSGERQKQIDTLKDAHAWVGKEDIPSALATTKARRDAINKTRRDLGLKTGSERDNFFVAQLQELDAADLAIKEGKTNKEAALQKLQGKIDQQKALVQQREGQLKDTERSLSIEQQNSLEERKQNDVQEAVMKNVDPSVKDYPEARKAVKARRDYIDAKLTGGAPLETSTRQMFGRMIKELDAADTFINSSEKGDTDAQKRYTDTIKELRGAQKNLDTSEKESDAMAAASEHVANHDFDKAAVAVQQRINALTKEIDALPDGDARKVKLMESRRTLEGIVKDLNTAADNKQKGQEVQKAQVDALRARLVKANDTIAALGDQLDTAEDNTKALLNVGPLLAKADYAGAVRAIDTRITQLKVNPKGLDATKVENYVLKLTAFKQSLLKLKAHHDAIDKGNADAIDALKKENAKLHQTIAEMKDAAVKLGKEHAAEVQGLENTITTLKQDNAEGIRAIEGISDALAPLDREPPEAGTAINNLKKLQASVDARRYPTIHRELGRIVSTLDNANDNIVKQIAEVVKQRDNALAKLRAANDKINELEGQLDTSKQTTQSFIDALVITSTEDINKAVASLNQRLVDLRAAKAAKPAEAAFYDGEIAKTIAFRNLLKAYSTGKEGEITAAKDEVNKLKLKVGALEATIASLQETIDVQEDTFKAVESAIQEARGDRPENLTNAKRIIDAEVARLQGLLPGATAEQAKNFRGQITHLQTVVKPLLESIHRDDVDKVKALKGQLKIKNAKIDALINKLDATEKFSGNVKAIYEVAVSGNIAGAIVQADTLVKTLQRKITTASPAEKGTLQLQLADAKGVLAFLKIAQKDAAKRNAADKKLLEDHADAIAKRDAELGKAARKIAGLEAKVATNEAFRNRIHGLYQTGESNPIAAISAAEGLVGELKAAKATAAPDQVANYTQLIKEAEAMVSFFRICAKNEADRTEADKALVRKHIAELDAKDADLAKSARKIAKLEAKLDATEKFSDSLKNIYQLALNSIDGAINNAETLIRDLQRQIGTAVDPQKGVLEGQLVQAEGTLKFLKIAKKDKAARTKADEKLLKDHADALTEKDAELGRKAGEIAELEVRLEVFADHTQYIMDGLSLAATGRAEDLRAAHKDFNDRIGQLEAQLANVPPPTAEQQRIMRRQIKQLRMADRLLDAVHKKDDKEIKKLTEELGAEDEDLKDALREITDLEDQLRGADRLTATIVRALMRAEDNPTAALRLINGQLEDLKDQLADARGDRELQDRIQTQIDQLKDAKYLIDLIAGDGDPSEIERLQVKLAEKNSALAKALKEVDSLKGRLDASKKTAAELAKEKAEQAKAIAELKDDIAERDARIKELEGKAKECRKQETELKQQPQTPAVRKKCEQVRTVRQATEAAVTTERRTCNACRRAVAQMEAGVQLDPVQISQERIPGGIRTRIRMSGRIALGGRVADAISGQLDQSTGAQLRLGADMSARQRANLFAVGGRAGGELVGTLQASIGQDAAAQATVAFMQLAAGDKSALGRLNAITNGQGEAIARRIMQSLNPRERRLLRKVARKLSGSADDASAIGSSLFEGLTDRDARDRERGNRDRRNSKRMRNILRDLSEGTISLEEANRKAGEILKDSKEGNKERKERRRGRERGRDRRERRERKERRENPKEKRRKRLEKRISRIEDTIEDNEGAIDDNKDEIRDLREELRDTDDRDERKELREEIRALREESKELREENKELREERDELEERLDGVDEDKDKDEDDEKGKEDKEKEQKEKRFMYKQRNKILAKIFASSDDLDVKNNMVQVKKTKKGYRLKIDIEALEETDGGEGFVEDLVDEFDDLDEKGEKIVSKQLDKKEFKQFVTDIAEAFDTLQPGQPRASEEKDFKRKLDKKSKKADDGRKGRRRKRK